MFAGRTRTHAHALFTDMRAELHNASFTLYGNLNNDSLYIRINAAEINTSTSTSLAPLTDQLINNVLKTSGTTFESNIDEELNALDTAYIWNNPGQSADARFTLQSISGTPTTAEIRVNVGSLGSATYGDDMELRAQLFQSNGTTPITEEVVVARWGANGTITAQFNQIYAGSVWTGAQLKFRWVYFPAISTPTIKLDPTVPSLAIGDPLPTGLLTGGAGIWAGRDSDGLYKMRIGQPGAVEMRWNGSEMRIFNAYGQATIVMDSSGAAYFDRPITLGTSGGGIWQGTGTFASPTTGLKIWRDGNVGRLATYNNGVQVELDSTGSLIAGSGQIKMNASGTRMKASGSAAWGTPAELVFETYAGSKFGYIDVYHIQNMNEGYFQIGAYFDRHQKRLPGIRPANPKRSVARWNQPGRVCVGGQHHTNGRTDKCQCDRRRHNHAEPFTEHRRRHHPVSQYHHGPGRL
jgi:hypothetical protein